MSLQETRSSSCKQESLDGVSLFDIRETENEYLIAIDIPSFPGEDLEILTTRQGLLIEGSLPSSPSRQKILQCEAKGPGIKAVYQGGMLWLKFPKYKTDWRVMGKTDLNSNLQIA